MKEYRNAVRIAFAAAEGEVLDGHQLAAEYPSDLDNRITQFAGIQIQRRALQTFMWLYHCKSIEEVQELFEEHLNAIVEVDSVDRYSRNAQQRLIEAKVAAVKRLRREE